MRILYLAPGHPAIQPGGTELLARGLFRALRDRGAEGLLLCADSGGRPPLPGTRIQPAGHGAPDDELIVSLPGCDRFRLEQPDAFALVATLAPIVERLRPEVIHLHHLLHWGAESLELLRRLAPRAALVLTLHDFFLLCPREGQLLDATGRPCAGPSPDACARCLPERAAGLALRREHLAGALGAADALVAPGEFLAARFRAAGHRPVIIRNGVAAGAPVPHRATSGPRNHFALLGQLTRAKGALVALRASALLSARGVDHRLDLHGPVAPGPFAAEFAAAVAAAPAARHHGAYAPEELPARLAGADWVLAPSTWFENAPLVVLEAFRHRRPVICSGHGGLAELVEDGRTGLHATPGDPDAWVEAMSRALGENSLWQTLADRIPNLRDLSAVADEHLALYRGLLAGRAPRRRPLAA